MKYYALYTSSFGPKTIEFDTEADRDEWAKGVGGDGEDYYAIDCEGSLKDAYILSTGE